MKALKTFINEANENIRLNSVEIKYDCSPSPYYIAAPESYQESDVQQYMNDKLLNELPSSQNYVDIFFGANADNIYDAYFEYTDFSRTESSSEYIDLPWDSHYAIKAENENDKLNVFKVTDLKYIIKFDRFDLVNVARYDIQKTLNTVFDTTISNEVNVYPITLSLDNENIKFT